MDKSKIKDLAARIFRGHPDSKELFFTDDSTAFLKEHQAKFHIKQTPDKLKGTDVTSITREDCADAIKALNTPGIAAKPKRQSSNAAADAALKAEEDKAKKDAADLNYSKMNKEALTAEAAKRTPPVVIPDGATNKEIIALLEADDDKATEQK